jgi:hypothetical protein
MRFTYSILISMFLVSFVSHCHSGRSVTLICPPISSKLLVNLSVLELVFFCLLDKESNKNLDKFSKGVRLYQ